MIRRQLIQGEKPEPIEHTFLDADGDAIDLTGYTGQGNYELPDGTTGTITSGDVTVGGADGTVTLVLPEAVCSLAGVVDLDVWAGNGTQRYAARWRLLVQDAVGTPPSI